MGKIAMKLILFAAALLAFSIANSQTATAQEKRLADAPRAFQTFFARFKAAVEKSDKTAVATLTKFPFRYGFDAGDEGEMTRQQFVKRFNDIFGASPKQFFKQKNLLFFKDKDNYTISTADAAHLSFVKSGDGFKFVAYIVEP